MGNHPVWKKNYSRSNILYNNSVGNNPTFERNTIPDGEGNNPLREKNSSVGEKTTLENNPKHQF